jgi:hypothetical protein
MKDITGFSTWAARGFKACIGIAILGATVAVFPGQSSAAAACDDCECIQQFGGCKAGNQGGPWEDTWCVYTSCSGTHCNYTCGFEECPPPSQEECNL